MAPCHSGADSVKKELQVTVEQGAEIGDRTQATTVGLQGVLDERYVKAPYHSGADPISKELQITVEQGAKVGSRTQATSSGLHEVLDGKYAAGTAQSTGLQDTVEPDVLVGGDMQLPVLSGEENKDDSQDWLGSKSDQEDWWDLTTEYGQEDQSFLTSRNVPDPVEGCRKEETAIVPESGSCLPSPLLENGLVVQGGRPTKLQVGGRQTNLFQYFDIFGGKKRMTVRVSDTSSEEECVLLTPSTPLETWVM